MTIAMALKTPEGVVIGADSTTTVLQGGGVAQLYNSAQKVFEIGPVNDRFVAGDCFSGAIVTYNAGSFGPVSWRNVVSNFYRERVRHNPAMRDVGRQFLSFLQECWSGLQIMAIVPPNTPIPDAGFLVATISQGCSEVECVKVELVNATVETIQTGGMSINGGFQVVSRLLNGYDSGLELALAAGGINITQFRQIAQKFRAIPAVATMPLRDAVDFVHFLVYSAIKLHRYRGGPASIGGPIELATVTADRGFRWILHKALCDSIGILKGMQL